MADDDKPFVIDGFHSVQAVRRVRDKNPGTGPRVRESGSAPPTPEKQPPPDKPASQAPPARVGQTTMPTRHEIVCYSCSYAFVHTGRLHKVLCPKCRQFLNTQDLEITGAWNEPVETIGTVEIKPGAVFGEARIVANRLIVAGDIRLARVDWCKTLELCDGAIFDVERFGEISLVIRANAKFDIKPPLTCNNLDIMGELKATVKVKGNAIIRAGGFLRGELEGQHLTVEEGGGISGRLAIMPDKK